MIRQNNVGNNSADLVLHTAGRVYIKSNDRRYELNFREKPKETNDTFDLYLDADNLYICTYLYNENEENDFPFSMSSLDASELRQDMYSKIRLISKKIDPDTTTVLGTCLIIEHDFLEEDPETSEVNVDRFYFGHDWVLDIYNSGYAVYTSGNRPNN